MKRDNLDNELEIQKRIAYTAGLLQGDVTIKTLIESLAEGVVIINEEGRVILINKRMSELTGFEKNEVMGQSLNIFIPEIFHEQHASQVKEYFAKPRIRPMGIGLELEAKKKDNTTFPVEISLSFLDSESGKLGIGFLTDISSRKLAENELKKRNSELDAYAHTVAHDLNTSLIGIVGLSELLIDPKEKYSQKELDSYLKQIAESSRKMSDIIRDLLIFATMKKEDVILSRIDMKEIINSVIQRLKFRIEETSAKITVKNIIDCYSYPSWIEEIWYNFISNAIKYGGNPPVIEIDCIKEKNYIKYSVKDNGKGIDKELKEVIFEENHNTKDMLTKGFGLGLSIVHRIIDKLDGKLTIDSQKGKGSIFSFYIKQ